MVQRIGEEVRGSIRRWRLRRHRLSAARFEAKLAQERAKVHLAAYKVKADIEWDIKWMSPLDKSWHVDVFIAVWAIPVIALFIPYTRPWALEFFQSLKDFDPKGPSIYLGGWALLFAATFGIKQATKMLPGRYSRLVSALAGAPDDVPDGAVQAAQGAVSPVPDDPDGGNTTPPATKE